MYSYISGTLMEMQEGFVVVDNHGIGYEIGVSNSTLASMPVIGKPVKLYIYHSIKEDEEALYGFFSPAEKNMFCKLIAVSGVGPKLALGVLSGISVQSLSTCILTGDVKSLSKIKGIGKKTAERIVLELKENVGEDSVLLSAASVGTAANMPVDNVAADAIQALESMGLTRSDVYEMVIKARATTSDVSEIIRTVLKSWKRI